MHILNLMTLNKCYNTLDGRFVFSAYGLMATNFFLFSDGYGPPYYEGEHAYVMHHVTDASQDKPRLPTIDEGMSYLTEIYHKKPKPIIAPLLLNHKIFGFIPIHHAVTLYYDPKANMATILDSASWVSGLFYPKTEMKQLIKKGLIPIVGNESSSAVSIKMAYQGIQYNMAHCGAWMCTNIVDLAVKGHSINAQKNAYIATDWVDVVSRNIDEVKAWITREKISIDIPGFDEGCIKPLPLNWFQKLWLRVLKFLYINFNYDNSSPKEAMFIPGECTYVTMSKQLAIPSIDNPISLEIQATHPEDPLDADHVLAENRDFNQEEDLERIWSLRN